LSIEKVSCRQHDEVPKNPGEETEETVLVLFLNLVKPAPDGILGNAKMGNFEPTRFGSWLLERALALA
jgi:hypothetical protein